MKTLATSLMLSFALIGGAAHAGSFGDPDNKPFQGVYGEQDQGNTVTRAQVDSQLQQAKADGQSTFGDPDNQPFQATADQAATNAQASAQPDESSHDVAFGDPDNQPFQGHYGDSDHGLTEQAQNSNGNYIR